MGGGEATPSVALDTAIISISMLIVIVSVVLLENMFHLLHILTKDTAFSEMILRIEKELMIVGSTAFIFRLIISPNNFSANGWENAINYADLLVPIFSFCYCGIGIILIMSSLRQCSLWSKAYHLHLIELLDEFLEKSSRLTFKLSWKPLNQIITKMEFRIFHAIFCDSFMVKSDSFAFDEYVSRVYEKYVFSIISIRLYHWFALIVLVLLNWARNALKVHYKSCGIDDIECKESSDIFIFTCAGFVLFIITAILVFASRNLEMKIMAKKNITSYKSYNSFLRLMQDASNTAAEDMDKLDEKSLREIVDKVSSKKLSEHLETENYLVLWAQESLLGARLYISRFFVSVYSSLVQMFGGRERNTTVSSTHASVDAGDNISADRLKSTEIKYITPSMSSSRLSQVFVTDSDCEAGSAIPILLDNGQPDGNEQSEAAKMNLPRDRKVENDANPIPDLSAMERVPKSADKGRVGGTSKPPRTLSKLTRTMSRRLSYSNVVVELKGEHIKGLFWLSNPALYFETVRFLIMLIALYIACWLVDYSASMVTLEWKIVSILPGIFSTINYLYVVKTAALLKAMYALDFESAEKVFKQIDGCRHLEIQIREKLLEKLRLLNARDMTSDMEARAYKLFCDIDYDHSGVIARPEFSIYLSHMNISLNRKQWKATFRHIDSDANEYISFNEFFVFLYPEHFEARRLEQHRLEVIHERVDQHIQQGNLEKQQSRRFSSVSSSTWAMLTNSSKLRNHANSNQVQQVVSVESDHEKNDDDTPFAREQSSTSNHNNINNNNNTDKFEATNNNNSSSSKNNSGKFTTNNKNSSSKNNNSNSDIDNNSFKGTRNRSGFGDTTATTTNLERRQSLSSSASPSQRSEQYQIQAINDTEDC